MYGPIGGRFAWARSWINEELAPGNPVISYFQGINSRGGGDALPANQHLEAVRAVIKCRRMQVQRFGGAGPEQAEGFAEIKRHPESLTLVFNRDEYMLANRDLG